MPVAYSVLILTRNEAENIKLLLPQVHEVLRGRDISYEIIIIDGASSDSTSEVGVALGAQVHQQKGAGYGAAFREGLGLCKGEWIITLDADHSHPPQFLRAMLDNHQGVDCLIASRYIPGGAAKMELYRAVLSKILSSLFKAILHVPVHDLSSGFRMYRRDAIATLQLTGRDFDVLIETLITLLAEGRRVREIPFIYEPRIFGRSNARVFEFAVSYLKTLGRLWNLKNAREAGDYEDRAYHSMIPLQRYWQRRRTAIVLSFLDKEKSTLDIGSGSSRVSRSLSRAVSLDCNRNPLRFLSNHGVLTVQANCLALPFPSGTFEQVVFSQVIEELPRVSCNLKEIVRVLKPGGALVLGTPNYQSPLWNLIEKIYLFVVAGGNRHNPRARYSKNEAKALVMEAGFKIVDEKCILNSEVIFSAKLDLLPVH